MKSIPTLTADNNRLLTNCLVWMPSKLLSSDMVYSSQFYVNIYENEKRPINFRTHCTDTFPLRPVSAECRAVGFASRCRRLRSCLPRSLVRKSNDASDVKLNLLPRALVSQHCSRLISRLLKVDIVLLRKCRCIKREKCRA